MPRRARTECLTPGCKRRGPYSIGLGLCRQCGLGRMVVGGQAGATRLQRRVAKQVGKHVGKLAASSLQRKTARKVGEAKSKRALKRAGKRSGLKRSAPRVLTIKPQWLRLILEGKKTWEIRSNDLKQLGPVHLSASGTNDIVATCEVSQCVRLTPGIFYDSIAKHRLSELGKVKHENPYAWVLTDEKRLDLPLVYKHKISAVMFTR